jgi:hypothetical protein
MEQVVELRLFISFFVISKKINVTNFGKTIQLPLADISNGGCRPYCRHWPYRRVQRRSDVTSRATSNHRLRRR